MSTKAAKIIGYGVAAGGALVALVFGLAVIPARSWPERWLHVLIAAAVIIGIGAVVGLALMVLGGLRHDQHHAP